jgi:hypothetical protein
MSLPNQDIKVYLAQTTSDTSALNLKLGSILRRAGFEVLLSDENDHEQSAHAMNHARCSIHLVGNDMDESSEKNLIQDFERAKTKFTIDPNFNIFVWHPEIIKAVNKNKKESNFLTNLRNSIYSNMIFSNHSSPVMFVEDLRNVLYAEKKVQFHVKSTDIFFIYNSLDNHSAQEIISMLMDVSSPETLKIDPSDQANYTRFISEQINKSLLTVVFFKNAVDWAVPFMQQIWKNSGGASISGEFLLIASKETLGEDKIEFEAPKTSIKITDDELIPLEIKVILDRISKQKAHD